MMRIVVSRANANGCIRYDNAGMSMEEKLGWRYVENLTESTLVMAVEVVPQHERLVVCSVVDCLVHIQ